VDTSTEDITGRVSGKKPVRTRKRRSIQEKLQIVRETLQSGASVAVIARRHGVNANQVFSWRREYRQGVLLEPSAESRRDRKAPALLPVQIGEAPLAAQEARAPSTSGSTQPQRVEIEFASGTRLRIWGGLGTEGLQAILRELSGPC